MSSSSNMISTGSIIIHDWKEYEQDHQYKLPSVWELIKMIFYTKKGEDELVEIIIY
jgi:hypothetical protein